MRPAAPAGPFPGELVDGETAAARAVEVSLGGDCLELVAPGSGERWSWPLDRVEVDPLVVGQVHVRHRDLPDALLTSSDPGLGAALSAAGRSWRLPSGGERWAQVLLYAGLTAAAVAGILVALPVVSKAIAHRVPPSVEARISNATLEVMRRGRCEDPSAQAALDALAARLRLSDDPRFEAARSEIVNLEATNAFTFPGGSVIVTRGLIDAADSPDELAGVLAHELEHVSQRHVMTQLVRSVLLTTGWQLTVGDFSGLMAVDPVTLMELASMRYSRDDEWAADEGAVRRLRHAGISTAGLASFFARLESDAGAEVPEILSSHPSSALRKQVAQAAAGAGTTPAMSEEEWRAVKGACATERRLGLGELLSGRD